MMWLVVVNTTQIQSYIFGSNRLRENVGASYLVDMATGDWAFEAVKQAALTQHNIGPGHMLKEEARIEQGLQAEVLYAGGGNFVVLFDSEKRVKEFQATLSQRVLEEASGLQLVVAQQELDWHEDALSKKLNEVRRMLAMRKRNRIWPAPLLGLSVTAACRSTGLPATGIVEGIRGEPGYLASDEIRAKASVARPQHCPTSETDQRLRQIITLEEAYRYPSDFEDLGGTVGEYGYIAIVHADGDGIGQRIAEICEKYQTAKENRACVQALRDFSRKVQQAAVNALKVVLDQLIGQLQGKDGDWCLVYKPSSKLSIQLSLAKDKHDCPYIPFRPIVFGGDDVTFVCDGRLGLALATAYLQEFEHQTAEAHLGKDDGGLTACAGIAIVKNHYPFTRAYTLAAQLTESAKSYRRAQSFSGSCLDWHFALSGLSGSIDDIRTREYKVGKESLTLRPVTLGDNPSQPERAWPVIRRGILAFQDESWAGRRNKIKALRDALREGPDAVKHFRLAFNNNEPLPEVLSGRGKDWPDTGWHGNVCGYFDAIEIADWFIPLEGETNETPAIVPVS